MNHHPPETDHEHHRRSVRLSGYDYSQNGAYFVTICTYNREHLFGEIKNGVMRLNDIGNIAQKYWDEIPRHYPFVVLDAFVVMPNHIHGIFVIERVPVGANNHSPVPVCASDPESPRPVLLPVSTSVPEQKIGNGFGNEGGFGFRAKNISPLRKPFGTSGTVGAVVRGYKIGVTKWCRTHARANIVWQRNYHERIIRDEREGNRIREYIEKNPELWEQDELNSFP